MNFVGLDLSFTETGVAIINHIGDIADTQSTYLIKTDSKDTPERRIIKISEDVCAFLAVKEPITMVYIEDKFVGANRKQALKDGGLLYHTIIQMITHFWDYKIIGPSTLKSFVIGTKGKKKGAKKELMLLHCFKKWGIEFENNNLCDAYCLARMALEDWGTSKKSQGNVKRTRRTI